MKRAAAALAACLLAGAAVAAGVAVPPAEMQRELENLDRQEAALTAWLEDVETIVRQGINNAGAPGQALYTPAYIDAMQRSLEAVRDKRRALARAIESQRPTGAGGTRD